MSVGAVIVGIEDAVVTRRSVRWILVEVVCFERMRGSLLLNFQICFSLSSKMVPVVEYDIRIVEQAMTVKQGKR